ncbi:hypothetical protein BKA80DRAFT_124461 [Phyllosticta citrichinensis]
MGAMIIGRGRAKMPRNKEPINQGQDRTGRPHHHHSRSRENAAYHGGRGGCCCCCCWAAHLIASHHRRIRGWSEREPSWRPHLTPPPVCLFIVCVRGWIGEEEDLQSCSGSCPRRTDGTRVIYTYGRRRAVGTYWQSVVWFGGQPVLSPFFLFNMDIIRHVESVVTMLSLRAIGSAPLQRLAESFAAASSRQKSRKRHPPGQPATCLRRTRMRANRCHANAIPHARHADWRE